MSYKLRKLRDTAAETVLRRIRRDRDASDVRLRGLLTRIERRLFDLDFNAKVLRNEAGIRDRSFSSWFHELDPPTPAAYIAANRLDTAAGMLRLDRDRTRIWGIATEVGYTIAAFNSSFKTRFHQTPTQYRKSHPDKSSAAVVDADSALAAGAPWSALDHLEGLDHARPDVAARLGLAWHGYAADEMLTGKIDDAYQHLAQARHHYSVAGELPPLITRHRVLTAVSCRTDEALLDALCHPCRELLLGDAGTSLRRHLRAALQLLPTDLDWFEACCDGCYGVVSTAVLLARLGFLSDAWQAWWLYKHANLDDSCGPPSVGRLILALHRVEGELHFQNQSDRLAVAKLAHTEAKALGQPLLELEARFWHGNVLRALTEFVDARKKLKVEGDLENPWLLALHQRFSGNLEEFTNNYRRALGCYRTAAELYKSLDPHVTGKLLFQMGVVNFEMKLYENAIGHYREALGFFDSRRDPLPAHAAVPISLAVATALLGDTSCAREELTRCRYDRDRHPAVVASEINTRGCIAQVEKRPREAVGLFAEAQRRFEALDQLCDAALAASHSVEGYYSLGEEAEAITCSEAAARFFEAAGCPLDTLEAVGRLQALLRSGASSRAVSVGVRRLARRHGGWLPDPVG